MIQRSIYFKKILEAKDTEDIKVITGILGSGKSVLLLQLKDYLKKENPSNNVIHIDMDSPNNQNLLDGKLFVEYVRKNYDSSKKNYLLVDEVQEIKGFERIFNSFHDERIFDIYITGSNAFLLNNDLATLFSGRTFSIAVYPFSFKEYCEYFNITNDYYKHFEKYFYDGGFSGTYVYPNFQTKLSHIKNDIVDTIVLRDISQKYRIKSKNQFNKLLNFLMSNISNTTSFYRVEKNLKDGDKKTKASGLTSKTIEKYTSYMMQAFIFYECGSFDMIGNRYLNSNSKYYLSDISLRFAQIGTKTIDFGRYLENIVYLELKRRGYEIYVGKMRNKEVDFIAIKPSEKKYIQVCWNIESQEAIKREITPLLSIKDAYEKIIISRTFQKPYDIDGVKVIDITD